MVMAMRRLSKQERARAFTASTALDLTPYLNGIREMEGDIAYAVSEPGVSYRALRLRLTRAAKQLGLSLRFGAGLPNVAELVVELCEG